MKKKFLSLLLAAIILAAAIPIGIYVSAPAKDDSKNKNEKSLTVNLGNFQWAHPTPTGEWLEGCSVSSAGDVLVAGRVGTILKGKNLKFEDLTNTNPNKTENDYFAVEWSPDGSQALIVGSYAEVLLYKNNQFIKLDPQIQYSGDIWFRGVGWRSDGKSALIVGSGAVYSYIASDRTIVNLTGQLKKDMGNVTSELRGADWKPDGSYALIVGDGVIIKYDGKKFTNIPHSYGGDMVRAVSWKPDGKYALIAVQPVSSTGKVVKYDGDKFEDVGETSSVYGIAWQKDGKYALVVAGIIILGDTNHGYVYKYDGSQLVEILDAPDHLFLAISWDVQGNGAYIPGILGSLYYYKDEGDSYSFTDICYRYSLFNSQVEGVGWKPDDSYAILVGTYPGDILKFDGANFERIPNIPEYYYYDVAWRPDGSKALITGGTDAGTGILLLYNGMGYIQIPTAYLGLHGHFRNAAWKPDGSYALISVGNMGGSEIPPFNGMLLRYDNNRMLLKPIKTDVNTPGNIAWKPDGSYALIPSLDGLLKYDGNKITKEANISCSVVSWHPSGKYAVIAGGGFLGNARLYLYQDNNLKLINGSYVVPGSNVSFSITSLSWKPDGSIMVMVGSPGIVGVLNGTNLTIMSRPTKEWLGRVQWRHDGTYALIVGNWADVLKFNGEYTSYVQKILSKHEYYIEDSSPTSLLGNKPFEGRVLF